MSTEMMHELAEETYRVARNNRLKESIITLIIVGVIYLIVKAFTDKDRW